MHQRFAPPLCGLSHLSKLGPDLVDHARRHRRRFRARTKPHLRATLCHCTAPWDPGRFAAPVWHRRSFWMRLHALELLRALDPFGPRMIAPAPEPRDGPWSDEYLEDALVSLYEPRVTITLRPGALASGGPAAVLARLGYRAERSRVGGARVLEAEREFPVRVRERVRETEAAPGLTHAELRAVFERSLRPRWRDYAPAEWLADP